MKIYYALRRTLNTLHNIIHRGLKSNLFALCAYVAFVNHWSTVIINLTLPVSSVEARDLFVEALLVWNVPLVVQMLLVQLFYIIADLRCRNRRQYFSHISSIKHKRHGKAHTLQKIGDQQSGAVVVTRQTAVRQILFNLQRKQIPVRDESRDVHVPLWAAVLFDVVCAAPG